MGSADFQQCLFEFFFKWEVQEVSQIEVVGAIFHTNQSSGTCAGMCMCYWIYTSNEKDCTQDFILVELFWLISYLFQY